MTAHDHLQLGAYALGALDLDEVREVDGHLAGCAECRQELAELEEMKEFLGEVPPEAFLEGPPVDGDLLLQRTLREVRSLEPVAKSQGSRWLVVAAALVVIAGALGGGVLVGRQSVDQVAVDTPPAGSKQAEATDASTGTTMATTVEPRAGWSWIVVDVAGAKAGTECELLVTDRAGKTRVAGSWVISEKGSREGSRFAGGALVPMDQVKSVEIRTVQGEHIVATPV